MSNTFSNTTSAVPPTEEPKLTPAALVLITVFFVFIGTILVTIGVGVTLGWAWAITVLGALLITFGLITGKSV